MTLLVLLQSSSLPALVADIVATNAPDGASLSAGTVERAEISSTEAGDSASLSARLVSVGAISSIESLDGCVATSHPVVSSSIASVEAGDTASVPSAPVDTGAIADTEVGDAGALAAHAVTTAVVNASEAPDGIGVSARGVVWASLVSLEAHDSSSAIAYSVAQGSISKDEGRDGCVAIAGTGDPLVASIATTEVGDGALARARVVRAPKFVIVVPAADHHVGLSLASGVRAKLQTIVTKKLAAAYDPMLIVEAEGNVAQTDANTLSEKDPSERWEVSIDFRLALRGCVIASTSWICVVAETGDPAPGILYGSEIEVMNEPHVRRHGVEGGVDGTVYKLIVTCTCTNAQVFIGVAYLPVLAA